jgi:hypothetical protein
MRVDHPMVNVLMPALATAEIALTLATASARAAQTTCDTPVATRQAQTTGRRPDTFELAAS